jgi:hypothetical protein
VVEDPKKENEETPPAAETPKGFSLINNSGLKVIKAVGALLPRMGLFLFISAIPLIIVAYPAYLIAPRLLDYPAATIVQAKLAGVEVKTIDSNDDQASFLKAKRYIAVDFSFEDGSGKKYITAVKKSWPSPGLKRKLDNQYEVGATYTLYLLEDKSVVLDEEVAKDKILRLTMLMGLFFVASVLLFLLWHRLVGRKPDILPGYPDAMAKSIMLGQLITLLLSAALAAMVAYSPTMVVPELMYLGAYGGLFVLLSLSLRLLVFEKKQPPAPEPEPEKKQARR